MLIDRTSLSRTVDAINAAHFEGRTLEAADEGLMRCLTRAAEDPRNGNPGLYCCGKCSVGLWRNLLAGGLDRREERLRRGALHLRSVRDGAGGWRKFPFWYTVLALGEMDSREAKAELKHAAATLERTANRAAPPTVDLPEHEKECDRQTTLATLKGMIALGFEIRRRDQRP